MMRCRDVEALDSAYIDGELDDARASAVRGHLRVCPDCRVRVEDVAALVDAAAGLEPVDPPPALWQQIERGLAAAEIEDAERSWLWLRWQAIRPRLLPVAVVATAAAVLVLWTVQKSRESRPDRARTAHSMSSATAPAEHAAPHDQDMGQDRGPDQAGDATPVPAESMLAAMARQVSEADRRYVATIDELRRMVDEDRAGWPAEVRAAYDARIQAFDRAAQGHRNALAGDAASMQASAQASAQAGNQASTMASTRTRDALYEVYHAQIEFLQEVALHGPEVEAVPVNTAPRGNAAHADRGGGQ